MQTSGAVAENKDTILPLEKSPSHVLRMSWKCLFLFLSYTREIPSNSFWSFFYFSFTSVCFLCKTFSNVHMQLTEIIVKGTLKI